MTGNGLTDYFVLYLIVSFNVSPNQILLHEKCTETNPKKFLSPELK